MCSSGGSVASTDAGLQAALSAASKTMLANYNTAFGEQNAVANQQAARLNYMVANPLGYSPQQLHNATSSINENVATAAKQAIGAAAGFAAAHGGADVGSGVAGSLVGQIASEAGQSKAKQLADLSNQNQSMKQQNLWSALGGLRDVGSQFGTEASTASSGGSSAAGEAVGAGTGETAAQQAGWQDVSGVLSGISGIAQAGVKAFKPGP